MLVWKWVLLLVETIPMMAITSIWNPTSVLFPFDSDVCYPNFHSSEHWFGCFLDIWKADLDKGWGGRWCSSRAPDVELEVGPRVRRVCGCARGWSWGCSCSCWTPRARCCCSTPAAPSSTCSSSQAPPRCPGRRQGGRRGQSSRHQGAVGWRYKIEISHFGGDISSCTCVNGFGGGFIFPFLWSDLQEINIRF